LHEFSGFGVEAGREEVREADYWWLKPARSDKSMKK
jgi:hypothetical protein